MLDSAAALPSSTPAGAPISPIMCMPVQQGHRYASKVRCTMSVICMQHVCIQLWHSPHSTIGEPSSTLCLRHWSTQCLGSIVALGRSSECTSMAVEYSAYRRVLNCSPCVLQCVRKCMREQHSCDGGVSPANPAPCLSAAPAPTPTPIAHSALLSVGRCAEDGTAASSSSGARVAMRKCSCSRIMCRCAYATSALELALAIGVPCTCAGISAGRGGLSCTSSSDGDFVLGVPRECERSMPMAWACGRTMGWAAPPHAEPTISGTNESQWSPWNIGICRVEVMAPNSSSMPPKRCTSPRACACLSMHTYQARSQARFGARTCSLGRPMNKYSSPSRGGSTQMCTCSKPRSRQLCT
mmetsp:Transcript_30900/g.71989  ORF Transcript_30900/g.71989 Transcript_30900/m.71989 type:complete len:354 (-) Transcript_30900:1091-2152(-)